jgi:hypothetical protein
MKKHHKITASERDQIAWWLACGVTLREMARRLTRSPCKVLNYQTPLEVLQLILIQAPGSPSYSIDVDMETQGFPLRNFPITVHNLLR